MASADDILNRAETALRRHGSEPRMAVRARQRARAGLVQKLGRAGFAAVAVIVGVIVWGLAIGPVGVGGVIVAALVLAALVAVSLLLPARVVAVGEVVPTTELALLPLKTEEWLASQRKALPAPAIRLVDDIGLKLEQLAPQLELLAETEPAAHEIRRLIAEELPELVRGYTRVPPSFRAKGLTGVGGASGGGGGISPDQQLVTGLGVVQSELTRMSEQLAAGELDKLATQGRFLELKYRGDGVG